jgi:hypothetical protein
MGLSLGKEQSRGFDPGGANMQFLIEKVLVNWRPQLIKSGHRILLPSLVGPLRLVVLRRACVGLSPNTGRAGPKAHPA